MNACRISMVLATIAVLCLCAGVASAFDATTPGDMHIPHPEPHDSPSARILWNAVAAVEVILIGLLSAYVIRLMKKPVRMPHADTWVSLDTNTVCHIDGANETWEAVVGDNKYELRPTKIDWQVSGCTGEVWCFKNNYPVGSFTLQKHPIHRNRLVLTITYTAEGETVGDSGGIRVVATLKRVE